MIDSRGDAEKETTGYILLRASASPRDTLNEAEEEQTGQYFPYLRAVLYMATTFSVGELS